MAKPSAGPPGEAPRPRPTQVLRAGPPPREGAVTRATAVAGILLLLLCVVLAVALPKVEHLPRQFRVTYVPVEHPTPRQDLSFSMASEEQRHQEVAFDVPLDNVFAIDVVLVFQDDQPATLPDAFVVRLVGPDGLDKTTAVVLRNEPGQPVGNPDLQAAGSYEAVPRSQAISISVGPRPRDEVVATQDRNATAAQVEATLAAQHRIESRGTWRLKVSLQEAGGCPDPGRPPPSPTPQEAKDFANRAAVCRSQAQPGADEDPGNSFTIASFTYLSFDVLAEELGT